MAENCHRNHVNMIIQLNMLMNALIMLNERQHHCLVLLRKVVTIGRRKVERNQVGNIASVQSTVPIATFPAMMIRHQVHPQALPPTAHLVMIAGQERSIARSVNEIGSVLTAVMNTELMTLLRLGIKLSSIISWKRI